MCKECVLKRLFTNDYCISIYVRDGSRKLNIVEFALSVITASKAYSFLMLTLNHAFCQVIVNTDCVLINNIFLCTL